MRRTIGYTIPATIIFSLLTFNAVLADEDQPETDEGAPAFAADPEEDAEDATETKPEKPSRAKRRPVAERFIVVEIDDEIVVLKTSDLAARRKTINEEYRAALKNFFALKKEAKEAGEAFKQTMPQKLDIKAFGVSFKTEEEANARRDSILAAREKANTKSKKPTSTSKRTARS